MSKFEAEVKTIDAVALALKGATIKYLTGSIDPKGYILVESLSLETAEGMPLILSALGHGFTISRFDEAYNPAKSVSDLTRAADPCAGCPGVEGGCQEHPAECGVSCGRWRRS